MSMRAGPKNRSSNNNSNNSSSNNHMSSKRASGSSTSSRRISESSSSLGSTAPTTSTTSVKQTTTTTTQQQQQQQQHAADKSSVKRKKRRKDDEEKEELSIAVVERVPVVLLTRLEDEIKSKESKSKQEATPTPATAAKVVIERSPVADDNESIKASSSDKSVAVGKRSTRHSVHRSSENLAGSDAKTLEPISEQQQQEEEKKKKEEAVVVVVVEESRPPPKKKSIASSKSADQTADSQSSKVESVDRPAAECNVNNVNNDNLKTTDPKITERQLLVRLDRSQVEDYLKKKSCAQRLRSDDKLSLAADTDDKYHSEDENRESDVLLSETSSQEIKTCAIPSDAGVADQTDIQSDSVERTSVDDDDVTGKIERIQPNTEEPVELESKKRSRTRKNKIVVKAARKVVVNRRLSTRAKRKVESQDIAGKCNEEDGDKDLRGNTKIDEESSVQTNENQIQRLDDDISKDTSRESAKSHRVLSRRSRPLSKSSSESLNDSATDSSKKSKKTDEINNEIIESNSIVDKSIASDGGNAVAEPVQLPMEVDDRSVADDSKAESASAQPICDIHSKNVAENAKSLPEEVETIDKSTKEILSGSTESLAKRLADSASSESPVEQLTNINDSAKKSNENDASANSIIVSETSGVSTDNLVSDEAVGSPSDSFMSCENAESTHGGSTSGENNDSLIETIEDTESSASTCTLIEETPEELSQNMDKELDEELPEDVDEQSEVSKEVTQDVPKEVDASKEPVAENKAESLENDAVDGNSKVNESFSHEDKIAENNEHESTFENNLKSVENLVIDSILNGEIVSPKIIARSASNKTEEVQTFVFESGVEDFVHDIEVPKETPVGLEPSTPVEVAANRDRPAPVAQESPVVQALEPARVVNAEIPVPVAAETTLPLPIAEQTAVEEPTAEKIVKSPLVSEKPKAPETSADKPVDEEFAKHRRKHTLSELKKKCTENIGKRQAAQTLEKDRELPPLDPNIVAENRVPSRDCFLEQTMVTNETYFENISDTESETCLADRLNRLGNLDIPSLEDSSCADKPVHSEGEESSRSEGTRRQRILMKITKTEANKHVTHLVDESKAEEEQQATSNDQQQQQFTGEQVTEGEIKIIMRKESTSNNHVIKEIKIIPRTPEGGNSARIPGYSPTSSDLSSGNSSCRVPSCSPAKPDSGSYRMPGWSPASTETGQTVTIRKKQGRAKKYPIFTESELIAKTTAIVNNVDVHASSNKLAAVAAEKPLFEPVESIRVDEQHEVLQQDDDDEEEEDELNRTVISGQMCLSGNQLLDAMPAKPEILAKYGSKIDETTLTKKKKKRGRARKCPLNDDAVVETSTTTTKVTGHATVARIEFNVVDSIEEFVEPPHSQSMESQASPTKKKGRGRPRKVPTLQDDSATLLEESAVEQGGDVPVVKKRGRKPRNFSREDATSMGETDDDTPVTEADVHAPVVQPRVERRGRKPWKHLKNNTESQLSENQIAEGAYSTTEDEAGHDVLEKHRGRRSHKLERGDATTDGAATEEETENESASVPEPRVERRGRKPWKHLKNNVASAENVTPLADNTQLNNESALSENQATEGETENENDASVPKARVERRGRKPWKHLKNNVAPVAESTQLNNESALSENQATEGETENENDASMPKTRVERRGRKPWKHLKNNIALAEGETSAVEIKKMTEDEAANDIPVFEPVVDPSAEGFLQDDDTATPENGVAEGVKSVAEDERINDTSMPEGPPVNETTSTIENEINECVADLKKKRGCKSLKSLQDAVNAVLEVEANSMTEDDFEDEASLIARITKKTEQQPVHFPNDSQSAEDTEDSAAENLNASDAPVPKKRGPKPWKHLLNKPDSGLPVGEKKKKRGRPRKIQLDANALPETQVVEAVNENTPAVESEKIAQEDTTALVAESTSSLTEDETVSSTEDIPTANRLDLKKQRGGRPPKIIKVTFANVAEESSSSMTEDETVSSTEDIPRVEQQQQQQLQPIAKKNKPGRPRKIVQFDMSSLVPSSADGSAMMVPPVVVKRRPGRPPKNLLLAEAAANDSTAPEDTATEDETVSSTEDIPRFEPYHPAMRKNKPGRPRKILPFATMEEETRNDSSMAASSMEDLSMVKPAPKKRGRKPRAAMIQNDESMEDLATFATPAVSPRKRGRPPKNLSPIKITLPKNQSIAEDASSDSIEEFSPVKQMSPVKQLKQRSKHDDSVTPMVLERVAATLYQATFGNEQPAYDRSLSPTKRRGRPPKYPRQYIIDRRGQEVLADESQGDSLVASPVMAEKRKCRPPSRLSQEENVLPGKNDAQSILSTTVLVHNEGDDVPATVPVSLGKRQGRPPRKFSPDEERSFSVLPQLESDPAAASMPAKRPPGRPRKQSLDDGLSAAAFSDSDETSVVKRRGRKPKKFTADEGGETVKRKGRPPKYLGYDETMPLPQPQTTTTTSETESTKRPEHSLAGDESPPLLPALPPPSTTIVSDNATKVMKASPEGATISTTNLLRQQRKPKMSQLQSQQQQATPPPATCVAVVAAAVQTSVVPQSEAATQVSPAKKRGRPKLPSFDIQKRQQQDDDDELPDNLTVEQLRRRRHSQDDSMFRAEDLPQLCKERPKEFEDAQQQPKRRRGRQPKLHDMSKHFVMKPLKPKTVDEAIAQAVSPNDNLALKELSMRNRLGRPKKVSPEKLYATVGLRAIAPKPAPTTTTTQETTQRITAADFLRTWTDRDDSPGSKAANNNAGQQCKFTKDDSSLPRDFVLGLPRPLSRNRLRRYSQGDAVEQSSGGDSLLPKRKRIRSSGSEDSLMQDEKRPRVEKELRDQHSITKELVVQLTKIDKSEESTTTTTPVVEQPQQQQQQQQLHQPIREIVKMSLRRKLESNNNAAGGGPPPLVPIEPRIQPATHSDAKLLMLMQPPDEKALQLHHPHPQQQHHHQHIQPAPQQFCIIFIPDALTSAESALNKDSQPTATIVNFQPVPDAELANKSVIYTPTTPTKIFVNDEQHNRSFLCATCTQALDLVGRLEANVGMTEEDKSAIKCPYCSNDFQSLFYLEYHLRQEHLKCENEKQCRHSGFNTLRIPSHDASSESEIYITFALKCRSCYALFENVLALNEHVKAKHANLIRHKPPSSFSNAGMVCYPPPPFKNGARTEVLHCPSDCICRIGIRSTDSPMQRAQVLKRCPNFMRRLEKIEPAAYEVFTCALCRGTFLMKDEMVEHLMKMHEVSCKFPCTKCLVSFRAVHTQESHHCSETTVRDLDKLLSIVILPTDKAHDNSKFEDSSNDELGPIKTTPPPASVPSASTPLNGVKRKNGVIQKLSKYLAMQPPKKPRLDAPTTPVSTKKRLKKTPCPKCQKKFAYRKSLNDHIIFEHIIPCKKADDASKKMAVELLQLVNAPEPNLARIEELARALGKYTDDDGVSLKKLTMINDEQENWNESAGKLDERDSLQCFNCKASFKPSANSANLARRNNHQQPQDSPPLCERCDLTRRRQQQQQRNVVNNGHNFNSKPTTNGEQQDSSQQPQVRYTYECDRCSRTYPTMIELNRHKSEEHSNKPSDALPCDVCPKIFYSSRMLEKHKKMHEDSLSRNASVVAEDGENQDCNNHSVGDVSKDSEANSSTSRRDSTDNSSNSNKEEEACKCPHCDFSAEKVSLKNHLKREHGVMAFICQFCGKLLVEISEVRHMLDYHIKSSRKNGGNVGYERSTDEVMELLRTLGKKRLQSLMVYHDFEGKCNNAIMRCPICPEQFATRESCRHHYQWMHDSTCILCDASFSGGNVAGQHKVAVHNSIASYVWAIQRLVSAIVHGLRLDRAHPSHVLYQEVGMRLDMYEEDGCCNAICVEGEQPATAASSAARNGNGKTTAEEAVASEPFLEPVVLSEDQLPGSGNMIEVVIGNDMVVEDSEDNLLENFYLSPNYESSCDQPKILDAGAPIPELEEEEEVVAAAAAAAPAIVNTLATVAMAATPSTTCPATLATLPATPSLTTSSGGILIPTTPVTAETYATSAVFKLRQDNGQEEVVLAITDEDLVTYRDDIGSLAERLSATCDSLSLEEITTMLRSYFENVGTPQAVEEVELASAIEPRTQ